ncbi:MAG: exodeoxyribonuclease VII large subunit, partial [Gemmatimonadetes bacterium]|nr:exodeoxyribonuclease VII large subunit [Gemmatimonadota bacterium]
GGGSAEDLWAFNDERVARALAESPVPTISAVGHEIDVTIADLVADWRAPTPSAAAERAVPDRAVLLREAAAYRDRIGEAVDRLLIARADRLRMLGQGLARAFSDRMAARRRELDTLAQRLQALSPLAVLKRGYGVPLDAQGHVLRGVAAFRPGVPFTLRVVGGRVVARTEDVLPEGSA